MILQRKHRFSVDEFYRMGETGIIGREQRVELLEGEVIEMSPIGSQHAACVRRLEKIFGAYFKEKVLLSVQNPIHLNDHSEPQPDIALLRPRADFYSQSHPAPRDILLVVEVADASLEDDRLVKSLLYAKSGIKEYWIINLIEKNIIIYRNPSSDGYQDCRIVGTGQKFSVEAFPKDVFYAGEIFG